MKLTLGDVAKHRDVTLDSITKRIYKEAMNDWKEEGNRQASAEMTLRDYFAAKALTTFSPQVKPYDTCAEIATYCYRMADAMLKAREA